jgi:hypothetical protein
MTVVPFRRDFACAALSLTRRSTRDAPEATAVESRGVSGFAWASVRECPLRRLLVGRGDPLGENPHLTFGIGGGEPPISRRRELEVGDVGSGVPRPRVK